MAQRGVLAALLLLALGPPALRAEGCSAPEDSRVTNLLVRMLKSFNPVDTPNPSVLFALRLATHHNRSIEHAMVQRLKEDAVNRVQNNLEFTSGTVALYVLALQASCENARSVSALDTTIDLVQLLEEKYELELKNVAEHKQVLTNYFQIGLDIMALCLQNVAVDLSHVLVVSCPQMKYGFGKHHSVDTASALALGLTCVVDRKNLQPKERPENVEIIRGCLLQTLLRGMKADGVIGNIYSTGLAIQALSVSPYSNKLSNRNCLYAVLNAINKGEFNNPMAASQITPSLQGRTYLDAGSLNCSADPDNLPLVYTLSNPIIPSPYEISVSYRVIDSVSHSFDNSITVDVLEGSTFLEVMETAQRLNPQDFSFTTKKGRWGLSVVSINGLAASTADKTYWKLQHGQTPLDRGIELYKPSTGEQLVSNFTAY